MKEIAFICAPNLALLDNWMPVLWELNKDKIDFKMSFILPKVRYVKEIDTENILFSLSTEIFDQIIFKNVYGRWLRADNYTSAKNLIKVSGLERSLLRLSRKLKYRRITKPFGNLLEKVCNWIDYYKTNPHHFDIDSYLGTIDCILYDIAAEGKSYNRNWIDAAGDVPKFSISHGINLNDDTQYSLRDGYDSLEKDNITAFVFTENERLKCKTAFALEDRHMDLVGIPRHDPDWMKFIMEKHNHTQPPLDNYVFVISRPHSTKYHTRERMKRTLEEIKEIVWDELEMNILVKLHPKEHKTGIYEEVFGEKNQGIKWDYSNLHPFILGRDCNFAICFESGVALDMILLDVPIIAKLDLRGIPDYDNEDSLRDPETGDPVFIYRYLGFNLGASNFQQMKKHVDNIFEDREKVMTKLHQNYYDYFVKMEESRKYIASKILKSLKS